MNTVVQIHDNKTEVPTYSYEEIMKMGGLFREVDGVNRIIWVIKDEKSPQMFILHHKYGVKLPVGDWSASIAKLYVKYDGKVTIELSNN